MPTIGRIIGGAGTGKTTALMELMEKALAQGDLDPMQVGFASFTRAARREAAERAAVKFGYKAADLESAGWFRTVHSVCYRVLSTKSGELLTGDKASARWVEEILQASVEPAFDDTDDPTLSLSWGSTEAGVALSLWQAARNRMEPLEATWRRAAAIDERVPDLEYCTETIRLYESAKVVHNRCDFVDLLGRFAGVKFDAEGHRMTDPLGEVPGLAVWFFDEQQDASPLIDMCCKRLAMASTVRWCYVVGDPFQCQPAGTPVLTAKGYKPIELLDPETDWIITFNKKEGRFYGTGGGIKFKKAWRDVDSGDLLEVRFADGTTSVCTSNHKWLVRTNRRSVYATYLMKKGSRWRVGTVQMFANQSPESSNKNGDFRLKMRMNQEGADSIWVLRVFDTDRNARMYEQIVSCRFGIPQVTFRPPSGCRNNLDAEFIETVFSELGDLSSNASRCLAEHGLEIDFPFSTKADRLKNGGKACRFIHTPNIIPGIHVVPKLHDTFFLRNERDSGIRRGQRIIGKEASWIGIESVKRLPPGEIVRVYSLDVQNHHTYVTTNGIVTGNSIYGFGGADSRCFRAWDVAKERTLPKSYRCPAPILDLGESVLRGCDDYFDRGIAPADHAGDVRFENDLNSVIDGILPGEQWLLVARTNFHARRLANLVDRSGIPWAPTRGNGGWLAPVKMKALCALQNLQEGVPIDVAEWQAILKNVPTKHENAELLVRGTKARWDSDEANDGSLILPGELESVGATPELTQRIADGRWQELIPDSRRFIQACERWGMEAVTKIGCRVGTIHSVKGMEADNVLLLTSTSGRVQRSAEVPELADEERRIAYVGVTRARRNLVVLDEPREKNRMEVE